MKKIIYLALSFPDVSKTTMLFTDLVHEFHNNGHDILVLAPAFDKKDTGLRLESDVKVIRVATMPLLNVGAVKKGIANLLLSGQYIKALKTNKVELDFDLIIMPTPPITVVKTASWIKKKSGAKFYLILRDIFPQNAVDLKMMKKGGILHSYFRKKEIELYNVSDAIGCMSPANIDFVKKHNPNIDAKKLHLLPNWEHLPEYKEETISEALLDKYNLRNKFILIFGGNIGKPQKMENIVALAKSCQEYKDILFFIIGKGTEKQKLTNLVAQLKLPNVILENNLPKQDYNDILRLADVGLISLSEDFTIPNYPSKVQSYFGNRKPVLASVDIHTDFGLMLEETNTGLWAEAGKTEILKEKLLQLYNSKELRKTMGDNGYKHMVDNLLPEKAYQTIMKNVDW